MNITFGYLQNITEQDILQLKKQTSQFSVVDELCNIIITMFGALCSYLLGYRCYLQQAEAQSHVENNTSKKKS